jgi:hypothetical protein
VVLRSTGSDEKNNLNGGKSGMIVSEPMHYQKRKEKKGVTWEPTQRWRQRFHPCCRRHQSQSDRERGSEDGNDGQPFRHTLDQVQDYNGQCRQQRCEKRTENYCWNLEMGVVVVNNG